MKKRIISLLKFLLFLSIGVTILYFVFQSQSEAYQEECALKGIPGAECSLMDKLIADFRSADPFWIVMMVLAFMVSNISRAIRWLLLLHPLGYRPKLSNSFWTIMLGYFANLGLPRSGEVIRAGVFGRYEKINVEKVMGTVVVDRGMDVICLAILMGLAFLLEFDTIWAYLSENTSMGSKVGSMQNLLLLGGFMVAVLGLLFFLFRKRIAKTVFYRRVKGILLGFLEGLKTILQLEKPWLFIVHTFLIWGMYFAMTLFGFYSFAPTAELTPVIALVVFVFGGLGIVIPSPGGMGTYHFLVIAALGLYGISGDDAFSLANIAFFAINIFGNISFGLMALILLPIINRTYEPKVEQLVAN